MLLLNLIIGHLIERSLDTDLNAMFAFEYHLDYF